MLMSAGILTGQFFSAMRLLVFIFAHSVTSCGYGVDASGTNIPSLLVDENWTTSTVNQGAHNHNSSSYLPSKRNDQLNGDSENGHHNVHSCCRGKEIPHGLASSVANPHPTVNSVKSEVTLPQKHVQSARFIAEEQVNDISSHPLNQIPQSNYVGTTDASVRKQSNPTVPPRISDKHVTLDAAVASTENDSLSKMRDILDASYDGEKDPSMKNRSDSPPNPSNSSSENRNNPQETGKSWLGFITSPLAMKAFKFVATEFYPKRFLDKLSQWMSSNSTRNGNVGPRKNLSVTVVYPLIMEGMSILANRLTENETSSIDSEESGPVVKGQIVHGVIESLSSILKPRKGDQSTTDFADKPEGNAPGKDVLDAGLLNQLLPLMESIPREDLQMAVDGLIDVIMNNTANIHSISNSSETYIAEILSQPKVLTVILRNRDKFSNLPGFQNNSALSEIFKRPSMIGAILKSKSALSDMGNLTNIISKFLPNNGAGEGLSPKNPLLRSDFASKILAKSPVAHMGALDEDIKRLIANSLEKAASRVKINEKGEIQIKDGMRKILGKMMDSDKSPGQNRTSDSLMGVLRSAMESGLVTVEPTRPPDDDRPVVRRNVTHHSPLHRKFQEKYGKYYQKSSAEPIWSSTLVVCVLPVLITLCLK